MLLRSPDDFRLDEVLEKGAGRGWRITREQALEELNPLDETLCHSGLGIGREERRQ